GPARLLEHSEDGDALIGPPDFTGLAKHPPPAARSIKLNRRIDLLNVAPPPIKRDSTAVAVENQEGVGRAGQTERATDFLHRLSIRSILTEVMDDDDCDPGFGGDLLQRLDGR